MRVIALTGDEALINYAKPIVAELRAAMVRVRLHHGGPQGAKPKAEVVADILASIKERRV